jgi:hypothetical protein
MINLNTKFQTHSSNGSLVTAIKQESKYKQHTATFLTSTQLQEILMKAAYFLNLYEHTTFQVPT